MFEFRDKQFGDKGPMVMGILNLTPDSFYAHSRINNISKLLDTAALMLEQGADILDLGAVSTRPGAQTIGVEQERQRLLPAIRALCAQFPDSILSVDTYQSEIAKMAIDEGCAMINDISGGTFDPKMAPLIGGENIPYVLMHVHQRPETMQNKPLNQEAFEQVKQFFLHQVQHFESYGARQLVLDPGFGFGKTIEANFDLLRQLNRLSINQLPILVGFSRKSMIYKTLNIEPENALNGTTVLNAFALQQGASILRVHDVKAAKECVRLYNLMVQPFAK